MNEYIEIRYIHKLYIMLDNDISWIIIYNMNGMRTDRLQELYVNPTLIGFLSELPTWGGGKILSILFLGTIYGMTILIRYYAYSPMTALHWNFLKLSIIT